MIRSENPNKQLLNYNRMALFKSIFNLEFKVIVRLSMLEYNKDQGQRKGDLLNAKKAQSNQITKYITI